MTDKYVTQLKIVAQNGLTFHPKMVQYKVSITSPGKKPFNAVGPFTNEGFSKVYEVQDLNAEIVFTIMDRGLDIQRVKAKAFKESERMYSKFTMKFTVANTEKKPNHVKEIYLDNSEVAWYLVKKSELFGDLVKRVYINAPTAEDWEILKANNAHLGTVNMMVQLQAGQVVVLANHKKETPKIKEYRNLAAQAQHKLDTLKRDPKFDPVFFAQNYELLLELHQKGKVKPLAKEVKIDFAEYFKKNMENDAFAYGLKEGSDVAVGLLEAGNKEVMESYRAIINAMEKERVAKSPLSYRNNFAMFKRHYQPLFDRFEKSTRTNMFKYDTGIKTNNMRDLVRKTAFVRGKNYKGGLSAYLENMEETSKTSIGLRWGGRALFAYDVYQSGEQVYESIKTGDEDKIRREVIKQTVKIEGGLVGGAAGSALAYGTTFLVLAVTVGTGGIGAIAILGVASVIGGVGGGYVGGILGQTGVDMTYEWLDKK